MKQFNNFSKIAFAASLLATTAMAAESDSPLSKEDRSRLDSLVTKVQKITSKAGLSMGGRFESRAFSSKIEGDSLVNQGKRTREDIMSTTLDLEMRARPLDAVSGTLIMRLHEDWRNMFAASGTPLQTRWLSIDGNVKKLFFYNLGAYKNKLSPYTIWAPTPKIDFEPEIFARNREDVMHEVFAGDESRVLQGGNVAFKASILPAFDELTLSVTGARLRKGGLEIEHGEFSPTALDQALMDRYLFAGNLDMGIRKDFGLGFTYLLVKDAEATFSTGTSLESEYEMRQTSVISLRGKLGTGFIEAIDADKINVKLFGEMALSNDRDSVEFEVDTVDVTVDGVDTIRVDSTVADKNVAGMGLNMGLDLSVGLADAGRLGLKASYTLNNEKFRNEVAQSPVFWKNPVINTEAITSEAAKLTMYNPFDALYKHVYKFAPSGDNAKKLGYHKMPMNKIAWTQSTFTDEELRDSVMTTAAFLTKEQYVSGVNESRFVDTDLMPVMTFGQATPNRAGIDAELSGVFIDSALSVKGMFTSMQEAKATDFDFTGTFAGLSRDSISGVKSYDEESGEYEVETQLDKNKYLQMGGGLSMDIAKFGNWYKYPIILSGSYKLTNIDGQYPVYVENADTAGTVTSIAFKKEDYKKTIGFLNAGLYFKFYKKAALLGGFQQLATTNDYTDVNRTMNQWAAGLEFKVTEGGTVTATYGNIKNEIDVDGEKDAINQKQMDLHLTVTF